LIMASHRFNKDEPGIILVELGKSTNTSTQYSMQMAHLMYIPFKKCLEYEASDCGKYGLDKTTFGEALNMEKIVLVCRFNNCTLVSKIDSAETRRSALWKEYPDPGVEWSILIDV
jgi:hypothetical protein